MHETPQQSTSRHCTYEWVLVNGKPMQMEVAIRASFPRTPKRDKEGNTSENKREDDIQEFKLPQTQSSYGKGARRFTSLQQTD